MDGGKNNNSPRWWFWFNIRFISVTIIVRIIAVTIVVVITLKTVITAIIVVTAIFGTLKIVVTGVLIGL